MGTGVDVRDYELFDAGAKSQLLRLETADGLVGWGEPTVEGRPESVAAVVERLLESSVLGADAGRIEDHWQAMYRSAFYRGGPDHMSAVAGIDQALWDLKGRRHSLPIHELLGGKARDRVKVYQWIHGETPDDLAADARGTVADGYRGLKFNATGTLRRIDTPAAVDAAGDRLAAHTGVPIATGERLFSRWDFRPLLEADAVDVVQPDLSHAGGITEVKKIAAAASLQVDACSPNALIQEAACLSRLPDYLATPSVFDVEGGSSTCPRGRGWAWRSTPRARPSAVR